MADPFVPAIYVDHRRCIGCNACSLACRQENNFENSPAVVAGARTTMSASQRWNEVFSYEQGSYPARGSQVATHSAHNPTWFRFRSSACRRNKFDGTTSP